MAIHQLQLKSFILPFIESGKKDLEIRVADEKRKSIQIGDILIFSGVYRRRVRAIRHYMSFEKMTETENPERIMPGYSPEQILSGLRTFYSSDKERLGVLVFELETAG